MAVGELVNHKSNDSAVFPAVPYFMSQQLPDRYVKVGGLTKQNKLLRLLWGYYTPNPNFHWIHFRLYQFMLFLQINLKSIKKYLHLFHEQYIMHNALGVVAQLVRASACHAEGRGFEPRQSRQYLPQWKLRFFI